MGSSLWKPAVACGIPGLAQIPPEPSPHACVSSRGPSEEAVGVLTSPPCSRGDPSRGARPCPPGSCCRGEAASRQHGFK